MALKSTFLKRDFQLPHQLNIQNYSNVKEGIPPFLFKKIFWLRQVNLYCEKFVLKKKNDKKLFYLL